MARREFPVEPATDLPEFVVKVDGTELERAVRDDVLRIDVHEEVGKLAHAVLLVRNWIDETNEVKHSDGDVFKPGAEVEVQLGYNGAFVPVFGGLVTGVEGRFRTGVTPVLEVRCRCRGSLLAGPRRSRVFEEQTEGDVVTAVAGEYGLTAEAETGAQHAFLAQWNVSDWEFLKARATTLGWILYVRDATLVFGPPELGDPVAELAWGATLTELAVTQAVERRADAAAAASWDPDALEVVEAEATAGGADVGSDTRPDLESVLGDAGWPNRGDRIGIPGQRGSDEVDTMARGAVNREALRYFQGQGRCLGLPDLRIGTSLGLGGLGERFSGVHYVSAVRHTLDSGGYFTEFQVGLPTELRPGSARSEPPGVEGIVPGVVEEIDDPNGWGRVRVSVPWLSGEIVSVWARLALPAAGPDRGFFFIPEVGDEVAVGFMGGDPRFPVVLGSFWNGQHAPPEQLDPDTNPIRAIVSRSGHRFTFDDSDGAELVRLETAAGQTLLLDDGGETVSLEDASGNKVTMSADGIVLESVADLKLVASSGTVAMEGSKIEGTSTGPSKLSSSAALDLEASAALGITGSVVKINS